ncbi:hypothetical protein [Gordonia oryzae]|uniref:hypothetical protein n=1 Tax=Gordonia oryzae TaxID=2487349 RepID=UPI000F4DFF3D
MSTFIIRPVYATIHNHDDVNEPIVNHHIDIGDRQATAKGMVFAADGTLVTHGTTTRIAFRHRRSLGIAGMPTAAAVSASTGCSDR